MSNTLWGWGMEQRVGGACGPPQVWNKLTWAPSLPQRLAARAPWSAYDGVRGDITWMSDFWPPGKGRCVRARTSREESEVGCHLQAQDTGALSVQMAAGY